MRIRDVVLAVSAFIALASVALAGLFTMRKIMWHEWIYVAGSFETDRVFCDHSPIPSIVFRTGKQPFELLDERVKQLYSDTDAANPGYITRYYSDEDCAAHISTYFDPRVLAAFHCLKPGAYKADLARLCLVYTFGGIYADFATKFEEPIDNMFVDRAADELVLLHDSVWNPHRGIYNAVFAARANHVFLKRCIEKIVENVENRFYGDSDLHPTGPCMMWPVYSALTQEFPNMPRRITSYHSPLVRKIIDIRSGTRIIHTKLQVVRAALGGTHYSAMWKRRDIYND